MCRCIFSLRFHCRLKSLNRISSKLTRDCVCLANSQFPESRWTPGQGISSLIIKRKKIVVCLYVCGVPEHNPKEQVFSTTVGLGHQIQVIRIGSEHLYLTSTCRGQRTTFRVGPPFLLFLRPGLSWPQSSRKGQEG